MARGKHPSNGGGPAAVGPPDHSHQHHPAVTTPPNALSINGGVGGDHTAVP